MGFLLGAFGKLSAGRRMRQLQARMMRVQSRARRVTRDVEKMEKLLQRQEKSELNSLTMYSNAIYNAAQQNLLQTNIQGFGTIQELQGQWANGQIDDKAREAMVAAQSQMSQMLAQSKAQNDMMAAQMKQQIEDKYEMLREQMLEPLKDEEEELQTEKDSLESQYEIAKNDYEACKKMEGADAKNLAPNYTGQG